MGSRVALVLLVPAAVICVGEASTSTELTSDRTTAGIVGGLVILLILSALTGTTTRAVRRLRKTLSRSRRAPTKRRTMSGLTFNLVGRIAALIIFGSNLSHNSGWALALMIVGFVVIALSTAFYVFLLFVTVTRWDELQASATAEERSMSGERAGNGTV